MLYNDTFNIVDACLIQKNLFPEICPMINKDCTHF